MGRGHVTRRGRRRRRRCVIASDKRARRAAGGRLPEADNMGCGSTTRTAGMRRQAPLPLFLALLMPLLILPGQLQATEPEVAGAEPAAGPQVIQPTRQSIYQHLMEEIKAAAGAEEHIKEVFAAVAQGMRDSVPVSVLPSLQAFVDSVVERAEDSWVAADDAGRTLQVKPCVDGAETDAEQVAKRALEKVEWCIKTVEEEGVRRMREVKRLLNEIEDVSKRFVTTLETCIKEEEAKEAADAEAEEGGGEPLAQEAATPETSTRCPKAKGAVEEGSAEEIVAAKPRCKACGKSTGGKCKKSSEGESSEEEISGEFMAQGDETVSEEAKNELADEQASKYGNERKGKKAKEWKDQSGKWKKDRSRVDESGERKESTKDKDWAKDKGKNKKGKNSEADKEAEGIENSNTEESSAEKNKIDNKSDKEGKNKKDKGGESREGKKSRKKRDLLAFNEEPDEEGAAADTSAAEPAPASAPASGPWPTEGATPEERRVIGCLRSLTVKPLIDQKTRAYQRLQAVLQRTSAKQQEAPACLTDNVHKAELKISAIKQRMASCAERRMRPEL